MKKNVASQFIGVQMITASDGSDFTGTVTCTIAKDGAALGAKAGTGPTHQATGYHEYAPTQGETNADHIAFHFTGTGAISTTVQVYTGFPQTVDNDVLAAGSTGFAAIDTVVDTLLARIIGTLESGSHNPASTAQLAALTDWINGGRLDLLLDAIPTTAMRGTDSAATEAKQDAAQTDLDTLTDARTEPAQGAPGVSETTNTKVDWLYKAWRNKTTQTSTQWSLYNDAEAVVDSKITVSDDTTTATKGEVKTGP